MTPPLPRPADSSLAGCVWLARIMAKARLLRAGKLPTEYADRFCHPTGVDGHFIAFFELDREAILSICERSDTELEAWFKALPTALLGRIAEWNHIAINLGRPGFPMADRLPVALATSYKHLADRGFETVFAVLEADEVD